MCLPQNSGKIFVQGNNPKEFSYIGWEKSIDALFFGYKEGYKNAADALVDFAINSGDNKTLDTFFYPICFLYRQYIELAMKRIYLDHSDDDLSTKKNKINKIGHNLKQMWDEIKPILEQAEKTYISPAEKYIQEFHLMDEKSDRFRYPITKKLDLTQQVEETIDLPNLKDRMNELYNFFTSISEMLAEYKAVNSSLTDYLSTYDFTSYDY